MDHEQANKYADLLEEFVAAVLAKEVERHRNGYTSESTDRTYYEARGAFVAALKAVPPTTRTQGDEDESKEDSVAATGTRQGLEAAHRLEAKASMRRV